jgi:hypothetical protein
MVALAALMLVAAALPAAAGNRGKGASVETTAPRGVLGGVREGTAASRDHRGGNPRGGGVSVTVKRVRSICVGLAC